VGRRYSFANGRTRARAHRRCAQLLPGQGYAVEELSVDPDGPGGLPPKAALRAEWEQAGRDLGLSDEDIAACSNKDQLIDLVTTQHEAKAADATAAEADPTAGAHAAADDTQNGATP
jgi:hypothetical protein